MKKSATIFLQAIIVLIGVGVLVLMLWEPHLEGRNAHAALFQIYFNDPFLAYAYMASTAFFVALYQSCRLFGYIGENKPPLQAVVNALRIIKYCGIVLVALVIAPEAYLFIVRPGDDIAGGVAIGFFLILVFVVIATVAAVFERILQNAGDIMSEND